MKKIENSFAVTGFIGKDADVRNFETASVARFAIIVRRGEKDAEGSASAFLSVEAWRKNENIADFELLKRSKKTITIEGYFKPEEWTDKESGEKRNRIILVATKFYEAVDVTEEQPAVEAPAPEPQKKTSKKKGK